MLTMKKSHFLCHLLSISQSEHFFSFLSCQIKLHLTKMDLRGQMLIYSTIFSGTYSSFGYLTTVLFSFEWAFMPSWHVTLGHLSWLLILMQQNANKHNSRNKKWEAHAIQVNHLFVFISLGHLPCVMVIQWHEAQNQSIRHQPFAVPCASTGPHLRHAQWALGINRVHPQNQPE